MTRLEAGPDAVLTFWLKAGHTKWFAHDPPFDAEVRVAFEDLHLTASTGALIDWAQTPNGALALVILLDQFPRNLYRGSAHAFATDPLALSTARRAVDAGLDRMVDPELRSFFYLPFEHSESVADQDRCVALFEALKAETGQDGMLPWAILHRDIIARFGRFPHRNSVLGRTTTPEEQDFLDSGGFAG